ncbi:hypothetical protein [Pseudomonas ovata]|uniref:hypothetical protein n=1 Tax=Pseudomonas ovata TaxID=1839709 RepID=UPI001F4D4BD0|nr:hypothetical protein [Pseudomonas ovata]
MNVNGSSAVSTTHVSHGTARPTSPASGFSQILQGLMSEKPHAVTQASPASRTDGIRLEHMWFSRRADTDSPFVNVTCKGPRAKVVEQAHDSFETHTRIPRGSEWRQYLLDKAANDPAEAADLARGYAYHSLNGQGVDMSYYPVIRYCGSGEIVNDESTAWFEKNLQLMQKQRSELYESELMKGTPAAVILEKILDFNDALPQRFRDMANW